MRHLTKRNDVYYFQRRIPTHLKDHYNGLTSIKFSLRTTERRRAIILARQHSANYDKEFYQLDLTLINKELEAIQLPTQQQVNPSTKDHVSHSKASDCIELYMTAKKQDKVSEKSLKRYLSRLELLVKILKDKDINSYTRDDALSFKNLLVQLPPNINNNPKYKDKTINQIIEFGDTPIGTHTINDTFKVISGFFDWLILNEKALKNPFTKLSIKKETKVSEERKAFTKSDLAKLFSVDAIRKNSKESWHYWLPYMGLYTGARIGELCQLYREDIQEVEGIWCISFNADKEDQKLKTKSSWRTIPIHKKLIELGLIDYIKQIPTGTRLFPTLKYLSDDGYGKYPSKWFSIQRDKALTKEERNKKTFHSLRHTVANEFKQMGIEYSPASYILGHFDESMTYGRYGKDYRVEKLKPIIDKLQFTV
ncbi:hypothetical protein BCU90_17345 [Vibrio lentus]|uniref:site-specific integrase n=1 Tax=Vibrio lentus TaxID=136468 RepID=UPI000C8589FE|nr:site-specific integrase [Vibrio lentus]PMG45629.1 hypothetical protein BCU90_17345 [Vibrio lentus]